MVQIIKRGGFREQTARQLKYKDSVNQRKDISAQQTVSRAKAEQQDTQPLDVEKTASEKQSELR